MVKFFLIFYVRTQDYGDQVELTVMTSVDYVSKKQILLVAKQLNLEIILTWLCLVPHSKTQDLRKLKRFTLVVAP